MISCFPNAIIANVPECPYGWEIGQLSLGGVCYTGVNTPGFYRFTIPDLTPRNLSYCATLSEVNLSCNFMNSFKIPVGVLNLNLHLHRRHAMHTE